MTEPSLSITITEHDATANEFIVKRDDEIRRMSVDDIIGMSMMFQPPEKFIGQEFRFEDESEAQEYLR